MADISVVTGGAGFIGSHIAAELIERGNHVRVVDNLCTGNLENLQEIRNEIEFIDADVCDAESLRSALKGAEFVFHQAALASVPLSVEKPLKVNEACVTGTLTVLQQARQAGVRRVIYAGSSSCYGDQHLGANRESHPVKPMSPYAVAKLSGEHYCNAFYQTFGLETVVLRYFNVFGPRQDPNSTYSAVIPLFISRLLAGKPPIVYGDGHQSRDFSYVANIVHGNLLAASVPEAAGHTFNVADGKSTTVLRLIELLSELLEVNIEPEFQPPRLGDIRESLADISEAKKILGYEPQVDFEQGLTRSIEYYRSMIDPVST